MLNISNRGVEAASHRKVESLQDANGFVLRVRGSFRQNFSGFLEPALSLENPRLRRERGLVPGRNLEDAIKDRLRLVKTAHGLECVGNS